MVAPMTNILFPPESVRGQMVVATGTLAASAAGVKTITIPNTYPEIDITLPNPVLAILKAQTGATLLIDGNGVYAIGGHCDGVPDSAGEFQITGVRTIDCWTLGNEVAVVLVCYISRGSGQKT